jgi:hypothetical protein
MEHKDQNKKAVSAGSITGLQEDIQDELYGAYEEDQSMKHELHPVFYSIYYRPTSFQYDLKVRTKSKL